MTPHECDPLPSKLENFSQQFLFCFFIKNFFQFQRKMGKLLFPFCLSAIVIVAFLVRDSNAQLQDGNNSSSVLSEREKKGEKNQCFSTGAGSWTLTLGLSKP